MICWPGSGFWKGDAARSMDVRARLWEPGIAIKELSSYLEVIYVNIYIYDSRRHRKLTMKKKRHTTPNSTGRETLVYSISPIPLRQ